MKNRKWGRCALALAVLGAVILPAGCGTDSKKTSPEAAYSASDSSAAVPESFEEEPAQSEEVSGEVYWTEESAATMEEWAASALAEAENGDVKEQAEDFLENVGNLTDRLNQIREETQAGYDDTRVKRSDKTCSHVFG